MSSEYRRLRAKHDKFGWMKPAGYNFIEVDEAVENYKKNLEEAVEIINRKDEIISSLKAENERLARELTSFQIQLEAITTPEYSRGESMEILNDFMSPQDVAEEEIDMLTPKKKKAPSPRVPQPQPQAPRPVNPKARAKINKKFGGSDGLPIVN